jgi:predicted transposase YdaD
MFESSYTAAVLEGRKEGLAEGMKEGERKKALQIARKLLKTGGLDLPGIAAMTELREEELIALQREIDESTD